MNRIKTAIKNYLNDNILQGALLLTGKWGIGKSYYFNKELLAFIKDECNFGCILLSVYGLKTVSEISEAIFSELKRINSTLYETCFVPNDTIATTVAKDIIRTKVNTLSSRDFIEIYNQLKLNNVLLVFEDVERASVNLIELFGYVNALTIKDRNKVLLIANESEIIKKAEKENKETDYRNLKSKTIIDTIPLIRDPIPVINEIIGEFKNNSINNLFKVFNDMHFEIISIFGKEMNFRSFKYGVKKTIDLLDVLSDKITLDEIIIKRILLSNLSFVKKIGNGEDIKWNSLSAKTSSELGSPKYPLFKFSFDYITRLDFDSNDAIDTLNTFKKSIEEQSNNKKVDLVLDSLVTFSEGTEKELAASLEELKILLWENLVPIGKYGNVLNYLIFFQTLHSDILYDKSEDCIQTMLQNIENVDTKEIKNISIYSGIELYSQKDKDKLNSLLFEMNKRLSKKDNSILSEKLSLETLGKMCDYIENNQGFFISKKAFISLFDEKQLAIILLKSTSSQIQQFRRAIFRVYDFNNLNDYFSSDIKPIAYLINRLNKASKNHYDAIKRMQLKYLISNLKEIKGKMEK